MRINNVIRHKGIKNTSFLVCLSFAWLCLAHSQSFIFWDESLCGYTGRDKPIADFFTHHKGKVNCFLGAAETLVRQSIDEYLKDGRDNLQVAFGCTGGQHRSVYFADRMSERLAGTDGVEIEVSHVAKPHWK